MSGCAEWNLFFSDFFALFFSMKVKIERNREKHCNRRHEEKLQTINPFMTQDVLDSAPEGNCQISLRSSSHYSTQSDDQARSQGGAMGAMPHPNS